MRDQRIPSHTNIMVQLPISLVKLLQIERVHRPYYFDLWQINSFAIYGNAEGPT